MTDKELLDLFIEPNYENTKEYMNFLFGDGKKTIMEKIIATDQFREFFHSCVNSGNDGEHYAYFHKNEVEEALGTHLSWLSYIAEKPISVNKEGDYFPIQAEAFYFEDKRYWLITMTGQGASSWVIDDTKFSEIYDWVKVE